MAEFWRMRSSQKADFRVRIPVGPILIVVNNVFDMY